jgi:hypothetical protein
MANGNPEPSSIEQAAAEHATEILARRKQARASRADALSMHPGPLSITTQISRVRHAGAAAEPTAAAKTGAAASEAAAAPVQTTVQTAGYLIAVGDSWFDYPIHDVLTNLDDHYGYNIESSAHRGDPIELMVSKVGQLDQFARLLEKVIALGAKPKAILISGGGDDIAGQEFGMLINDFDTPIGGWNQQVVAGVIDTRIAGAYRMMFSTINAICQQSLNETFPIIAHGYDYPVPDGRGFLGGWPFPGPWLKPGFDEKRFPFVFPGVTTQMMAALIDRFNTMLQNVAGEPGFANVKYLNLRGTLSNAAGYTDYWANELHPTGGDPLSPGKDGFSAVAAKFQGLLSQLP